MDPFAFGEIVSVMTGKQEILAPASGGFSAQEVREAVGDRMKWKYRQGILDGIRTAAMDAALSNTDLDGDATIHLLPMILGLKMNANTGEQVFIGRHSFPAGMDFFEGIVGPALVRATGRTVTNEGWAPTDAAIAITEMRQQWYQ